MTDNELLNAISNIVQEQVQPLKTDMQVMKDDMQVMKDDMQVMKDDMQKLNLRMNAVEVKLENETNQNLQLLAENHINLVDKLNQAIHVADKTLLYEVQVSGLKMRVETLEKDIAEIKSKIA